jgi:hypothetical protein
MITSINDTILAALISAIVTVVIGFVTFVTTTVWNSRKLRQELRRERERTEEAITSELIRQRIEPYVEFMRSLEPMSNTRMAQLPEEERRKEAASFSDLFHRAIYGEVCLLATHETREVIVCARARCRYYSEGKCGYDKMLNSIWAIHQMLRADLNLRQPKLAHAIERLQQQPAESNEAIADLIDNQLSHLDHSLESISELKVSGVKDA